MEGHVKLFTTPGKVMLTVWHYGYATANEIAEHLNLSTKWTEIHLKNLLQSGILYRRKVGNIWVFSIEHSWATTNPDILAMLEAVEVAKSEGFNPTVRQL